MKHPHQSSLDLLCTLAAGRPPRFPSVLGDYMEWRAKQLADDPSTTREAIDETIGEFGRYVWPFRRAWDELYVRDARKDERERFLGALPAGVVERAKRDAGAAGVTVQDVLRLPILESNYIPEERLVLEDALREARHGASSALAARLDAGEIPDYETIAIRWKRERLDIEEQLIELQKLALRKPQWADEIANHVREFHLGFSGVVGETPTLHIVTGVVADYAGRAST
jgi:hypothetical protein